jgi:hypothetical protein
VQTTLRKLHLAACSPQFLSVRLRHVGFIALALLTAYKAAQYIVDDDLLDLAFVGAAVVAMFAVLKILSHWRKGFYLFLIWLVFEDVVRKYLGNNAMVFFVKDALLGVVYLSFFMAYRRKEVRVFRPFFLIPLLVLVWFGLLQIFNPASPSVLFGILGFKLFFLYVPLLFVGYELVTSEIELRRFFLVNVIIILIVGSLGIAQSIIGPTFLNPETLGEDIREMGNLYHVSPASNVQVFRASSVFVSPGRYGNFLVVSWLLVLGFTGYLLLRHQGGRRRAFIALACIAGAIILTGSRGPFMWGMGSLIVTWIAFIWGAPWRRKQATRLMRAFQRSAIGVTLAVTLLFFVFPNALSSRLALYSETLSPNSPQRDLAFRAWDYPLRNFLGAFDFERWPYGYGIGTTSLGSQYVKRIFHVNPLPIGVESGFGSIVLEMGLGGLMLWLGVSISILIAAWREVKHLKGSPCFPIAFIIFLYTFILLLPMTFMNLAGYQDFIPNAYLWLLLGILFRLRTIDVSVPVATGQSEIQNRHDIYSSLPKTVHQRPLHS